MMAKSERLLPLGDLARASESDADLLAYMVVGRAVISWGMLEQNLSRAAGRLHTEYGGKNRAPYSFTDKIALWNKCFETDARLEQFKERALSLSALMTEAAEKRNYLLHSEFRPGEDVTKPMKGTMLKAKGKGWERSSVDMPLKAINGLVNDISSVNLQFGLLWVEVLNMAAVIKAKASKRSLD